MVVVVGSADAAGGNLNCLRQLFSPLLPLPPSPTRAGGKRAARRRAGRSVQMRDLRDVSEEQHGGGRGIPDDGASGRAGALVLINLSTVKRRYCIRTLYILRVLYFFQTEFSSDRLSHSLTHTHTHTLTHSPTHMLLLCTYTSLLNFVCSLQRLAQTDHNDYGDNDVELNEDAYDAPYDAGGCKC